MQRDTSLLFLVVITLMGSVGLLATDIYLPALPEMTEYFNCSQTDIQASFTLFLLGLAFCQLVYGSLADRFGRKKVTLLGISLFIVASFLCSMSETLYQFLFFRLLQAMGGGVGSVVNRAIIADKYNRIEAAQIFSTIFPFIGLSAAIGPWIGGYLSYFAGWKSVFYFMTGFGVLVWVLVFFFLEESQRVDKNVTDNMTEKNIHTSLSLSRSFSRHVLGYFSVLKNINFLGYALIVCTSFATFRCFSVESPFVFDRQGFAANEMGSFYLALSIAYVVGNLIARWLVSSRSLEKVMNYGYLCLVLGGLCMIMCSYYFGHNPYAIILPMAMITLGNGFLFPTGSAGAMSAVPTVYSGRASGLMGALQFTLSAFFINWVGQFCQGHAFSLSIFIGGIILFAVLCYRFLVQKPKMASSLMTEMTDRD